MFNEMPDLRVARGAAWLDTVLPGWCRNIDLELLDMEHPWRCIIGQLSEGDYCGFMAHHEMDHFEQIRLGFESGHIEYVTEHSEYPALQEAWTYYLKNRMGV